MCSGRWLAKKLAEAGQDWSRRAAAEMPSASGDIREIVNEPVFVPLYSLFRVYGPIFKLSFGPQSFVVISDPAMAKQVRFPFFVCVSLLAACTNARLRVTRSSDRCHAYRESA